MKTISKTPIGLTLPLKNGGQGFFDQTYCTFEQKKANIINLLRTKVGERRMQPTFGSRLWTIVFEQNTDVLPEMIENIVTEDISKWIDNVKIKNVDIKIPLNEESLSNRDIYKLYITITFMVNITEEEGDVSVIVDFNKT
jgi:phage baseplate assembly protein W